MTRPLSEYHDLLARSAPGTPGGWLYLPNERVIVNESGGEIAVPSFNSYDARAIAALPNLHRAAGELLAEVERLREVIRANSDARCGCQTCSSLSAALGPEGAGDG